jgi:hypothetical protein
VQQELIAEVQGTAVWSVVVTVDGNIRKQDETDFTDKYGSYIILIPDGNVNSFLADIKGLFVRQGKLTRVWNYDARYVVAGTNKFSILQKKLIFHAFSKLRIYNCIIVSLEHDVISREYSRQETLNEVDTGMKLGVYTWFPYQSSESCDNVVDIIILDSWVIYGQGHFTKNTDLFPRKIGNSFNGCPMKALVNVGHSFLATQFTYQKDSNGNVVRSIRGLEIKLLQTALWYMNMTLQSTASDRASVPIKTLGDVSSYMLAKKVYIFLGSQGNHPIIASLFDTTSVYNMDSFRWYVPCSVKYPRWSSIYRILSVELWVVLIISIVIVAISTTLVGRYSCTSEWQGYKTVTSSLTNVWAVIIGVSVSTMPRAPSLRSLFLAWVCFSIAFSTVFLAFLTTFLVDSGYKTPVQSMDELFGSGMKLAYSPAHSFLFENGNETKESNVRRMKANCPSFDDCVNWALYNKNVSVFLADLDFQIQSDYGDYAGVNGETLICMVDDGVYLDVQSVMIMFYGEPLLKRINEMFGRVVEAGLYNFWLYKLVIQHKIKYKKIAIFNPLDEYYSFNLYHMQPAFYLLLMGLCLSGFCFVIELVCYRFFN